VKDERSRKECSLLLFCGDVLAKRCLFLLVIHFNSHVTKKKKKQRPAAHYFPYLKGEWVFVTTPEE
jgi:hypothetical protein